MEKRWYYGKTYGTIPRTMELQFTKEKKHGRLPNTEKLRFIFEVFRTAYNFDLIWKTMVPWKKQWFYGEKNYATMVKTMLLFLNIWNFDLLWKNQ